MAINGITGPAAVRAGVSAERLRHLEQGDPARGEVDWPMHGTGGHPGAELHGTLARATLADQAPISLLVLLFDDGRMVPVGCNRM